MVGQPTYRLARSRSTRRAIQLAIAAVLALLLGACLRPAPASAALPPQGVYEQCAPNSTTVDCGARLKAIAAAGFKYVLNYTAWYGNAQQVRHYADEAATAGVKLIWPLNDAAWRDGTDLTSYYRYLGPSCGCNGNNAAFKQFALGLVKNHPATWGFYLGDEVIPSQQNVSQVAALAQQVKSIAPDKPTLYIAMERNNDITSQLEPFVPSADYAGSDYYPVQGAANLGGVPDISQTTRDLAGKYGKQPVMVLQSFSWSQYLGDRPYLFPTRSQMEQMRDDAITYGNPGMLLWYSYNDLVTSNDPRDNWKALQQAAFAPYVTVAGARAGCSARGLRVNVQANWKLKQARALVDGHRGVRTKRNSFRVRTGGLSSGFHSLRVTASDSHGNATKRAVRFRTCG